MPFIDEMSLRHHLTGLSLPKQIAFATLCCERQFPTYTACYAQTTCGDPASIHHLLMTLWDVVLGQTNGATAVSLLRARHASLAPSDTLWRTCLFTQPAETLIACIEATCAFLQDHDLSQLVHIARRSLDSVGKYLADTGYPLVDLLHPPRDPAVPGWLAKAPLLVEELTRQEHDLAALATVELTATAIQHLRLASHHCGIQPFRRRMVPSAHLPPAWTGLA